MKMLSFLARYMLGVMIIMCWMKYHGVVMNGKTMVFAELIMGVVWYQILKEIFGEERLNQWLNL